MRVRVEVRLRPGVLDPAAATIHRSLQQLGFVDVAEVTQSRIFELDIAKTRAEDALAEARSMADRLLANPVIETYRIDLVE